MVTPHHVFLKCYVTNYSWELAQTRIRSGPCQNRLVPIGTIVNRSKETYITSRAPNQKELIYHHHLSYHISDRRSLSRTQPQRWLPQSSPTSPTLLSPTILTTPLRSRSPHTSRTNGLSQCFSRHSAASARRYCSPRRLSSISCTQTFAPWRKSPSGGSFSVCAPLNSHPGPTN